MRGAVLLFIGLTFLTILGFYGCKKCNLDCMVAPIELHYTPEDSLCFGHWEWAYTVKKLKNWQNQWIVADTLYPGESESGFETLDFVHGTVSDRDIRFNISGKQVCGCYENRNSALFGLDTVVGCHFRNWEAPGYSGLGVDVFIPEVPGEPVYAQISGLRMFYVADEDSEGVRYRNFFVKME